MAVLGILIGQVTSKSEPDISILYTGRYYIDPNSAEKVAAKVEPALANAEDGEKFQFVRMGYFAKDTKHPNTFNKIVALKDSFKV